MPLPTRRAPQGAAMSLPLAALSPNLRRMLREEFDGEVLRNSQQPMTLRGPFPCSGDGPPSFIIYYFPPDSLSGPHERPCLFLLALPEIGRAHV